jgi:hypothetical protein
VWFTSSIDFAARPGRHPRLNLSSGSVLSMAMLLRDPRTFHRVLFSDTDMHWRIVPGNFEIMAEKSSANIAVS